jgi:hypothetical protein
MSDVEVSTEIKADPKVVYDLVSDLPRMGEWSPENTGGRWVGGATGPAVGAKFKGTNRKGFRRWSTTCTITDAAPGEVFAFDVDYGPTAISHWEYVLTTTPSGTRVTESWTDRRPTWMKLGGVVAMGVADRGAHNRRSMETTLAELKAAAEKA